MFIQVIGMFLFVLLLALCGAGIYLLIELVDIKVFYEGVTSNEDANEK